MGQGEHLRGARRWDWNCPRDQLGGQRKKAKTRFQTQGPEQPTILSFFLHSSGAALDLALCVGGNTGQCADTHRDSDRRGDQGRDRDVQRLVAQRVPTQEGVHRRDGS